MSVRNCTTELYGRIRFNCSAIHASDTIKGLEKWLWEAIERILNSVFVTHHGNQLMVDDRESFSVQLTIAANSLSSSTEHRRDISKVS